MDQDRGAEADSAGGDPSRSAPGEEPEGGGVFGNLPGSRPGRRSPQRDRAARRGRGAKASGARASGRERAPTTSGEAGSGPRAAAREPARHDPEPGSAPAGRTGGGLEDLAWAGVAAAAEAATLGVRLASRAMEAVRDTVERR